jgi:hypothetical protein
MPKKELKALEKITHNLFVSAGEAEMTLTKDEQLIKERYSHVITRWLSDPSMPDKHIVNFLMNQYKIEKSQAYRDLANVKIIMGNIQNATKEWMRYTVSQGLLGCIQKARSEKKLMEEITAYDKLAKYFKLDKEEDEPIPWEKLLPPDFELSSDVRVLDPKLHVPDIEEKRQRLREKYRNASDVDYDINQGT